MFWPKKILARFIQKLRENAEFVYAAAIDALAKETPEFLIPYSEAFRDCTTEIWHCQSKIA